MDLLHPHQLTIAASSAALVRASSCWAVPGSFRRLSTRQPLCRQRVMSPRTRASRLGFSSAQANVNALRRTTRAALTTLRSAVRQLPTRTIQCWTTSPMSFAYISHITRQGFSERLLSRWPYRFHSSRASLFASASALDKSLFEVQHLGRHALAMRTVHPHLFSRSLLGCRPRWRASSRSLRRLWLATASGTRTARSLAGNLAFAPTKPQLQRLTPRSLQGAKGLNEIQADGSVSLVECRAGHQAGQPVAAFGAEAGQKPQIEKPRSARRRRPRAWPQPPNPASGRARGRLSSAGRKLSGEQI